MARAAANTPSKTITVNQVDNQAKSPAGKVKMMDLFEHNLKALYWAEKRLSTVLPKIIKEVDSEELRELLEKYLAATAKQLTTLELVFRAIDVKPKGRVCYGIDGLIKECEEGIASFDHPMLDPLILVSILKIEQYEITAYTSLIELAKSLDLLRPAKVLRDILKEEKEAFKQLEDMTELHVKRAYLWQVDFD